MPPDPGEFVGLAAVESIIAGLRERVDVVLVDVPPLLPVGDALTIGRFTDAVIVVVRADLARRQSTGELARILDRMPCEKLGFILCGADSIENYPYYGGYSGHRYEAGRKRAEETVR
jgi:Mrp family chromosome partitioning ATPase